jgi:hypothetical protein
MTYHIYISNSSIQQPRCGPNIFGIGKLLRLGFSENKFTK